MGVIQAVVPFFFILIALVVIHELGHFFTAKMFGVKVLEFGIGYPPRIWGFKRGETEYTINWLPLGGFVKLLGEEDPTEKRSLAAQAAWKRIVVMAAGSAMNFVLPVLLFAASFMIPRDVPLTLVQIANVVPDAPAGEAGILPGDILLEVNGREIRNSSEASYNINLNLGETMTWTVKRGSEILELEVYGRFERPSNQGATGVEIAPIYNYTERESFAPWTALEKGFTQTHETITLFINQVRTWMAGSQDPEFSGPVGIAQTTGEVVEEAGWRSLIELAALLSLNLAIINILPLPMLDGGRIFFVLIEIVRGGRRISPQKEALVHLTGFVLMLVGVLVISYFDILRVINGDSVFR